MTEPVHELAASLPCDASYFAIEGAPAFVFMPREASRTPTPWVWYAPTFIGGNPRDHNGWYFQRFLDAGMAVAGVEVGESYGNPAGRALFTALYKHLTVERNTGAPGLSKRPVLHPQSRGGLMLYNWAAEHPDCVAAVVGIYTVCDMRSYPGLENAAPAYDMTADELASVLVEHNPVDRLAPLAAWTVPILHIHGDSDTAVPIEENSGALQTRYRALGGHMELIVVPGLGHEAHAAYFENEEVAEFTIRHGCAGR